MEEVHADELSSLLHTEQRIIEVESLRQVRIFVCGGPCHVCVFLVSVFGLCFEVRVGADTVHTWSSASSKPNLCARCRCPPLLSVFNFELRLNMRMCVAGHEDTSVCCAVARVNFGSP